jgi:hypothetical protein
MTTNLTSLWDGDTISRSTRDDYVRLENRRGNILFMVQGHVIKDILNNKMFQEQGFTHRILICQIDDFEKPDMCLTTETDKIQKQNIARSNLQLYLNRLREILQTRATYIENRDFELRPKVITLDDDSHNLLAKYHNQTKGIGVDKLHRYQGFANRLHEHILRIAGTIAVYNGHEVININDTQCAIDLIELFIEHRTKLELGVTDTRPELTQGSTILEDWFIKQGQLEYTKRELRQYIRSLRDISDEQLRTILAELISKEVIEVTEGVAKNGKVVQKYRKILSTP